MFYYVYNESLGFKVYRFLFLRNQSNVLYWKRSSNNKNNFLPYPPNGEFYILLKKSRKHVSEYYSSLLSDCEDRYFVDYFKKSVSYPFYDYYAFVTAVERHASNRQLSHKIVGGGFLDRIYRNKIESFSYLNSIVFLIAVFFSLAKIIKKIFLCLVDGDSINMPDIIFYRKKNLPDPVRYNEIVSQRFNKKVSSESFSFNYSTSNNVNNIVSLNKFKSSFACTMRSLQQLITNIYKNMLYLVRLNLPMKFLYQYMQSVFDATMIVKLNFKIMVGVLEKPIFIMVNKFKQDFQKVCVIGDSFIFEPVVHLDYLYGDRFYAWNNIDYSHVNNNGGVFDKVLFIGSPRSSSKSTSQGLTTELDNLMNEYSKVVLVTTTQIYQNDKTYYPFSINDLNSFIGEINTIANKHKNKLFIIKYKKGEYKLLHSKIFNESSKLKNVYPVLSDIPLELKYNQFEDLINKADLLISICFWSTTIWQMLQRKKPVIACNNQAPSSFLSSYDNLEVKYSNIGKSIDYWLSMGDEEFNNFIAKIDGMTNLSLNGTELLFNDLNELMLMEQ